MTRSLSIGMRRCGQSTVPTLCNNKHSSHSSRSKLRNNLHIKTPTAAPSSPTIRHNKKKPVDLLLSVHWHCEVLEGVVRCIFNEHCLARTVGVQPHRVARDSLKRV